MDFWTIEVADGPNASAAAWREAHGERLVEAALTHGAQDWDWVVREWGVLLEVCFRDERDWSRFRATVAVQAALDAVPDPVNGIFVYSGRGGSSGATIRRRPRPAPLAGGEALPEPQTEPIDRLAGLAQAEFLTSRSDVSAPEPIPVPA